METKAVTLILIAVFEFAVLVLLFAREFMQDLARTIDAWRELREKWQGRDKKGLRDESPDD